LEPEVNGLQHQVGYCTNVHAGADLNTTLAMLNQHAVEVRRLFSPDAPMGIGLWLSASTARDVIDEWGVERLRDWLNERSLLPFTFNGFPFGDFHQEVVKYQVYQPTWADPKRLQYTLDLIDIMQVLLPANMNGSISTLPIAWPEPSPSPEFLKFAATQLQQVALRLAEIEHATGRLITLCLEPEPGCFLQYSQDVVQLFDQWLSQDSGSADLSRRYLRVCHDVCHASVMFETQKSVIDLYHHYGIQIGKVQISTPVELDLRKIGSTDRPAAIDQLARFVEPRYLHQTSLDFDDRPREFYEDLPDAIRRLRELKPNEAVCARVHFHLPIYVERFGYLNTTHHEIAECVKALNGDTSMNHYEVETYAWNVLPPELQQPTLAAGIAAELNWFKTQLSPRGST
jgi:hypothetical protein